MPQETEKIIFFGEIIEVPKLEPLDSEVYEILAQTMYENSKSEPTIEGML